MFQLKKRIDTIVTIKLNTYPFLLGTILYLLVSFPKIHIYFCVVLKIFRIRNVRRTLKGICNTLLGTYILFKNVQLLLTLNTECFIEKRIIHLKWISKIWNVLALNIKWIRNFFWEINALKIVKKFRWMRFLSRILCPPKALKKVQFKLQKCLAKIFIKDAYYQFRKKPINSIASLKLWSKSLKSCLRLRR